MTGKETVVREIRVDEVARIEASQLVERSADRSVATITLTLDDGDALQVPPRLAGFVADLVAGLAAGVGVSTTVLPEELTTTVAADVIGVSRPTLMKMIARGEVQARMVGTHHRLRRSDVLAVRDARRTARSSAAAELRRAGEAFD